MARPESFSFPSGHACAAFASATAAAKYNKRCGICLYIFAAVMAFSRVYVHVHYCTDVLAGALFGIIYGIAGILIAIPVYKLIDRIILKKLESKLLKNQPAE